MLGLLKYDVASINIRIKYNLTKMNREMMRLQGGGAAG